MSTAAAASALHSDHVNYLVWRYLQEHGFEQTARAFTTDWQRSSALRNPQSLPFAHAVGRNELVSTLQYGISYDVLQSQVRRKDLRFKWSRIDARASIDQQEDPTENGAGSRIPTARRKAKSSTERGPDDFPTPQPKRQRRSEGSDVHVNGERDAMNIDTVSADGEEDAAGTSPTATSEPEHVEAMERYDSMDVMVQTDFKAGPQTCTISWRFDADQAEIQRALWSPQADEDGSRTLLTVGDRLCRFYQLPNLFVDVKQVTHMDEPSLQNQGAVTAAAWRPDGKAACCALDGMRDLPGGGQAVQQVLLEVVLNGGSTSFRLGSPIIEPPGLIMSLQYSPDGQFLLALRGNTNRSLVQVWKSAQTEDVEKDSFADPVAWKLFDGDIADATWTDNDSFVVCGDNSVTAWYQIDDSQQHGTGMPSTGVDMRALISRNANVVNGETAWDMVRFDRKHRIAAFTSRQDGLLVLTARLRANDDEPSSEHKIKLPENKFVESIAFEPLQQLDNSNEAAGHDDSASLLVASLDDGSFHVYATHLTSDKAISCDKLAVLSLANPPAAVLAWSPDGAYLAVANEELVQIWRASTFFKKHGSLHLSEALVTWRATATTNDDEDEDLQPSLSWSPEGENLAFAAKREVAIIRFTPPLHESASQPELNGVTGP